MRRDKREPLQLRKLKIKKDILKYAEGSCQIEMGNTKVICSASIEDKVPMFLRGQNKGWVTAEYGMLPRSCTKRIQRESSRGKQSGRTQEIQRLIGRSLRSCVDLDKLGERTIWIDCDVIQGDGGTRTASITGSFIAMAEALKLLKKHKEIDHIPINDYVAAVSVGIVDGETCLDLDYLEDSNAEVDMNIVMTGKGRIVELQGTAERKSFSKKDLDKLFSYGKSGIERLIEHQRSILKLDII